MGEPKNSEQYEVNEAMDMLGKGYHDETPIEIHAPHTVLEHKKGYGLEYTERGAWIKLSVSFRDVVSHLKGSKLAVFLVIALGINKKGESFPSYETIAEWTGYSRRSVATAIQELEDGGFLTITKGKKNSNLYAVNAFASFGTGNDPSSANFALVQKTTSSSAIYDTKTGENMSQIAPELEVLTREVNKSADAHENKEDRLSEAKDRKAKQQAERDARGGLMGMYLDQHEREKQLAEIHERIEKAIRIDPRGSRFEPLVNFILRKENEGQTIEQYAAWMKEDPYNSPKTHQIANKPTLIMTTWPAAFAAVEEETEQRPEWQPYVEEEMEFVPNPNSR